VQTKEIALAPALASIPLGLLTAVLLLNHDLIFYDVYKQGGKRSLAVVLGRALTRRLGLVLSALCYLSIILFTAFRVFPPTSLISLVAVVVFGLLLRALSKPNLQVPDYAKATMTSLLHSLVFGVLLSLGFLLAS
jgi:1,4-dihydroxy-2-naphthoate octaprenyltransferase